jgi:uncharacterized protein (TIRG00374 family)
VKTWLKYGLHVAVLAGIAIAAVRYLNGEEVVSALGEFRYAIAPFILGLSALYLALKAWRFHVLLTPFSRTDRATVMRAYAAGQPATLLPGGIAARIGLLDQAEVEAEDSTVAVTFSSLLDQAVFLAATIVAAVFFAPARMPAAIIGGAVLVVGLLLLVPAVRSGAARAATWAARKVGQEETWRAFTGNVGELLTGRALWIAVALTVGTMLAEVLALDLTIRGLAEPVGYSTLALAYVLPTMLGRLSGLPAGLGVTEAGMVGFLVGFSPLGTGTATAVAVVFRIGTIFFRALLGLVIYLVAWGGDDEDARSDAGDRSESASAGRAQR